jgi:hypothetical protein
MLRNTGLRERRPKTGVGSRKFSCVLIFAVFRLRSSVFRLNTSLLIFLKEVPYQPPQVPYKNRCQKHEQ